MVKTLTFYVAMVTNEEEEYNASQFGAISEMSEPHSLQIESLSSREEGLNSLNQCPPDQSKRIVGISYSEIPLLQTLSFWGRNKTSTPY